ncbi:hypothetical protein CA13_10580 [Planctomycetes bacterium CA13]|uniref:Uncharacterized protein n=2 Tax=Novipirellula herctigrandis TaxID=2527986 RepID=A0A5C5YXA6_9BACT|nr:hypothetical protein CA13_10580 [Planctomycetes bacterium CA13]
MPLHRILLISLVSTFGCSTDTEQSTPWISQAIALRNIDAITIVEDGGLIQDGGTVELYGVTKSGHRCFIRLNQHALYGDYLLATAESPGRLCFNNQLIDVRSADEEELLRLLKNAEVKSVGLDGLRQLIKTKSNTTDQIRSLSYGSRDEYLQDRVDSIVDYVESERYVDVARNGFPPYSKHDRQP